MDPRHGSSLIRFIHVVAASMLNVEFIKLYAADTKISLYFDKAK